MMTASYLTAPLVFLIDTVVTLYLVAILLRFLLQWVGGDFYNPVARMLLQITQPPLRLMRRYIPPLGGIDTSSLVLMLSLQMLADTLIYLLEGVTSNFAAIAVLAVSQLLLLLLNVYTFAVFARAILSWVSPAASHAATGILYDLTEPLLVFCRRSVPGMAGIDFSPVIVLIVLQLLKMLLLPPLQQLTALLG